ncbi:hypothetical protein [Treponema endosymbiont of Eucomonympha sp.]|uniref:hypothetical protein n=1 Tax=Treponema endosymbiont of Eucomonympha sp. TaxID=1580831 RepID=UPI00078346BA|nr:hypothetical protein [Treponema endosymbiont of Eucomonympha sp.]
MLSVINSSAAQTLSLTRFLVNDWWMTPQKIFIIDGVPEKHQERIAGELRNVEYDRADEFDVVFTTDGGLCDVEIKKEDVLFKKACLFGTAWDQLTANYKQRPFVRVSAPYGDSVIGNKTYFGWNGALTFLQDLHDDITSKILGSGVVVKLDDIGGH